MNNSKNIKKNDVNSLDLLSKAVSLFVENNKNELTELHLVTLINDKGIKMLEIKVALEKRECDLK